MILARIAWKRTPPVPDPTGLGYSTVAKFTVRVSPYLEIDEYWSIVFKPTELADELTNVQHGTIRLLVDEKTDEMLSPGLKFELFEGEKSVGDVEILGG